MGVSLWFCSHDTTLTMWTHTQTILLICLIFLTLLTDSTLASASTYCESNAAIKCQTQANKMKWVEKQELFRQVLNQYSHRRRLTTIYSAHVDTQHCGLIKFDVYYQLILKNRHQSESAATISHVLKGQRQKGRAIPK